MVDEQTDGWPMSPEVAREIREQTESEREMALEQLRGRKGTNRYSFWDTLVIVGF
jgi:predicted nucleic acid-binding protein